MMGKAEEGKASLYNYLFADVMPLEDEVAEALT